LTSDILPAKLCYVKIDGELIMKARLAANMSRADLAHAIRTATGNELKASERGVRGWELDEYAPSSAAIAAIAKVTNHEIEFFYGEGEVHAPPPGEPFRDGTPPSSDSSGGARSGTGTPPASEVTEAA
jgi:transcriptional regulator with XRE-family HTH domain